MNDEVEGRHRKGQGVRCSHGMSRLDNARLKNISMLCNFVV